VSISLARKIAAVKKEVAKARAGKNSFPQTPFLIITPYQFAVNRKFFKINFFNNLAFYLY